METFHFLSLHLMSCDVGIVSSLWATFAGVHSGGGFMGYLYGGLAVSLVQHRHVASMVVCWKACCAVLPSQLAMPTSTKPRDAPGQHSC